MVDISRTRMPHWRSVVSGVSLVLLALSVPSFYLQGVISGRNISDADHLYLAELLPSLASGTAITEWTVPLANYLVVDWPLYGLALVLGGSVTLSVALFALFQNILLGAVIWVLHGEIKGTRSVGVTIVTWSVMVATAGLNQPPGVYIGTAFNHFGTWLLTLGALIVSLRWARRPTHGLLMISGIITMVAVGSDRIFAVWLVLPMVVTLAALAVLNHVATREAVKAVSVQFLASAIGVTIPGILFPTRTPYPVIFDAVEIGDGLARFVDNLKVSLRYSETQAGVAVVSVLLLALFLYWPGVLAKMTDSGLVVTYLRLFVPAALVSTSAAVATMHGIGIHVRHYMPLFLLPLVLSGGLAASWLAKTWVDGPRSFGRPISGWLGVAWLILPVGWLGYSAINPALGWSVDRPTVPIDCIADASLQFGSQRGIASYWDARPIEVFSGGALDMAIIGPDLSNDPTNTDLTEFRSSYDFAVVSDTAPGWRLPYEALIDRSGPPRREVSCGEYLVANWGPGGLVFQP